MHTKYKVSISCGSKVRTKVNFFIKNRVTDRTKTRCPESHSADTTQLIVAVKVTTVNRGACEDIHL